MVPRKWCRRRLPVRGATARLRLPASSTLRLSAGPSAAITEDCPTCATDGAEKVLPAPATCSGCQGVAPIFCQKKFKLRSGPSLAMTVEFPT